MKELSGGETERTWLTKKGKGTVSFGENGKGGGATRG
jgi:hypothetical protein